MSAAASSEVVFARRRPWAKDLALVAAAVLIAFVVQASGGFGTLTDARGDNDALMRLVQVRDLLGGQGWFDLHQYRMGLDGGFVMHWSRIVDLPIAGLILLGWTITGDMALAEQIALVVWPLLLYGVSAFLILKAAVRVGGEQASTPALVVGGITLYVVSGLFAPGSLDHHNLQLILTLTLVLALLADPLNRLAAYAAGASAALMLAIGVETLPYVAVGGTAVALMFLVRGGAERQRAARYGAAFAGTALACFVLTVSRDLWLTPHCDAFSVVHLSVAALAGAGLAVLALVPATAGGFTRRALGLAILGAAVVLLVAVAFPQCLGDPYAGLDPRLREIWLDSVSEAQSVRSVLKHDPLLFANYYVTPLLALAVTAWWLVRRGPDRRLLIVGGFLAGAVLVSFWQLRGSMFSVPLAVVPLAAWIGERRALAERSPSHANSLKMILAWMASINLVWFAAAGAAQDMLGWNSVIAADGADEQACYRAGDYERLAALPPDTVLAVSNLGASILRHTRHRTLAGSYHRNVEGNLAALDIFMGSGVVAEDAVRRLNIGLVAICPGNAETEDLAERAPDGFIAELSQGALPGWLEPVPGTESATLRIYRVRQR